jgi:TRAP-type mannitol/chloroaromatic compound transport system substrate-binding protein
MDANMLLAWHKHGGGQPLLAKLYAAIGVDVISFLGGPQPPQPLGWFKKPIARPEDLVGLRLRTDPVSAQLFRQLGAQVSTLPPAQASAAMAAGTLDAAQLTDNAADGALGSAAAGRVCMLGSYHQSAEQFELLIRRQSFDSLPARARAIIENAVEAASQTALWKSIDRYSRAHAELRAVRDVAFYRTPDAVLESQLAAHDALAAARARDPLVVEIEQSQKAFAARALRWQLETAPGAELAYRHYFGAPAPRTPAPRKK